MDIKKLASQLLDEQFSGVSADKASEAMNSLLGDGKGGLDISGIVKQLGDQGGLQNVVQSWLGDGDNESVSANQLMDALDGDKLSGFAEKLGLAKEDATNGLSELLPKLIDQSSSGGELLESVGGLGGLLNKAKDLVS